MIFPLGRGHRNGFTKRPLLSWAPLPMYGQPLHSSKNAIEDPHDKTALYHFKPGSRLFLLRTRDPSLRPGCPEMDREDSSKRTYVFCFPRKSVLELGYAIAESHSSCDEFQAHTPSLGGSGDNHCAHGARTLAPRTSSNSDPASSNRPNASPSR